jgi:hypothetical protein
LADGRIASDRPTAIFFGTAHCWNTNREAERFVALYRKHSDDARFLVVDLEHPSAGQQKLISRFYGGAIPTLTFLDRKGIVVYDRAGRQRGSAETSPRWRESFSKLRGADLRRWSGIVVRLERYRIASQSLPSAHRRDHDQLAALSSLLRHSSARRERMGR